MQIGSISVGYLAHVSFLFRSSSGTTILADPLYAEGFEWRGHFERYLSPPELPRQALPGVDALFISHVHGDHYDVPTVSFLMSRDRCEVWAPEEVSEAIAASAQELSEGGGSGPQSEIRPIGDGEHRRFRDFEIEFLAGYDNSRDVRGRANKFSMLLSSGGTSIFYSGDCHEPPPAMVGRSVDALIAWPHPKDENVRRLGETIRSPLHVMMHGDRFEPGDFYCNFDYEHEKRRIERLVPGTRALLLPRMTTQSLREL